MSDYSTAATNAADYLSGVEGGLVEEYETPAGGRVKRGSVTAQVDAAIKLEALAARRAGGIFTLAKARRPQ